MEKYHVLCVVLAFRRKKTKREPSATYHDEIEVRLLVTIEIHAFTGLSQYAPPSERGQETFPNVSLQVRRLLL
jgi:hypothetical protein